MERHYKIFLLHHENFYVQAFIVPIFTMLCTTAILVRSSSFLTGGVISLTLIGTVALMLYITVKESRLVAEKNKGIVHLFGQGQVAKDCAAVLFSWTHGCSIFVLQLDSDNHQGMVYLVLLIMIALPLHFLTQKKFKKKIVLDYYGVVEFFYLPHTESVGLLKFGTLLFIAPLSKARIFFDGVNEKFDYEIQLIEKGIYKR